MGKKHFCFVQAAEAGNRTPNSGVKGSGANHYPRAPAQCGYDMLARVHRIKKVWMCHVGESRKNENMISEESIYVDGRSHLFNEVLLSDT